LQLNPLSGLLFVFPCHKMSPGSASYYNYLFTFGFASTAAALNILEVPWSDKVYGPDGPWQAVSITVGGNDSRLTIGAQNHADIDLYPGGQWNTLTFSKTACEPYPNSHCGEGGTWEPDEYATQLIQGWHPPLGDSSWGLSSGPLDYTQRAMTIGGKTVWNASIATTNIGNRTFFDGTREGLRLGFLALGAPDEVQTFADPQIQGQNVTLQIFNAKLFREGTLASYSYSLHVGSASFGYPGSLIFGGYNKGRVIAPLTSSKTPDTFDLLDIGIGVEYGVSPSSDFTPQTGFLVSNTSATGQKLTVKVDPLTPYLSLPNKTCERLATVLPIQWDTDIGYFLWKTDEPNFKAIVTSPSYLSFIFPPEIGSNTNVTIKVPFALLNLTLTDPIVNAPTQYFPCHDFTPDSGDYHRLGRAFLQAAFIGRNWGSQHTWLAQAPGPGYGGKGLGDELREIADDATTLDTWQSDTKNFFNESWSGHWSIIDSPAPSGTGDKGSTEVVPSAHGLSTSAKAGIGVGVLLASLIAVAVALFWRRHRAKTLSNETHYHEPIHQYAGSGSGKAVFASNYPHTPTTADPLQAPQELHSGYELHELPELSYPRST
jgi:hypothetical protein